MKQSRRKELKTNELSIYLQQIREAISRHQNTILLALVAVIVVLAVGMIVRKQRHAAYEAAYADYLDLRDQSVIAQPELLEQAAALAATHADDAGLGPLTAELYAGMAYELAMNQTNLDNRARRVELFNTARSTLEGLLQRWGSRPMVAPRTRISLAAVLESLHVLGEGDIETIRKTYQSVIDGPPSAFTDDAKEQLKTLAERTAKLELVATRPAEPVIPTTQPTVQITPVEPPAAAEPATPAEPVPPEATPVEPAAAPEPSPAEPTVEPSPAPTPEPPATPAAPPAAAEPPAPAEPPATAPQP